MFPTNEVTHYLYESRTCPILLIVATDGLLKLGSFLQDLSKKVKERFAKLDPVQFQYVKIQ
jgi:hypothetical protein